MRLLSCLFVFALLIHAPVHATSMPKNHHDYSSALEAVRAASRSHLPDSIDEDREFIGAIVQIGNRYRYTVGSGAPGQDTVTVRIKRPAAGRIVAFWHTHGSPAPERRYFSRVDVSLVEEHGIPFYLADPEGVLRVLRPGAPLLSASRAFRLGLPKRHGYAQGETVSDHSGQSIRIVGNSI